MSDDHLSQTIKHAIYGIPEVKPDERRYYLTTLRERVYVALTNQQVKQKHIYDEVNQWMQSVLNIQQLHLYLNGKLSYTYLAKYIKLATQNQCPYTIVQNRKHDTPIGLVLASHKAVDRANIFIKDEHFDLPSKSAEGEEQQGKKI